MSDKCDLHARKIKIESELLRAITLGPAIEPPHILADEPKLRRIFESHFAGHRHVYRVVRELGITS